MAGETDFKKIYCQHVQENIDLKKHVNSLEYAKMKRVQEISDLQNKFLRKYNKYVDGSLHPSKRTTTGLNPQKPLPALQGLGGRRKSCSEISVTKKHGANMPVDFPYSYDSWQSLINTGCRILNSGELSPLDAIRDRLVREPMPEFVSLEDEQFPVSRKNQADHECSNENNPVSNDVGTNLRNSENNTPETVLIGKKRDSLRFSAGEQNLLKREKLQSHISSLTNENVTVNVNNVEQNNSDAKMAPKQVKFPSIELEKCIIASRHDDDEYDKDNETTKKLSQRTATPMKQTSRKRRSNSLAPGMLQSFQVKHGFRSVTPIEEEPTPIRERSKSFGEIDKIRARLSESIKSKVSLDKATLQILVENSKGINKFKYLTKMVNVGLREMHAEDNDKADLTYSRQSSMADIFDCRYLRMPRSEKTNDVN